MAIGCLQTPDFDDGMQLDGVEERFTLSRCHYIVRDTICIWGNIYLELLYGGIEIWLRAPKKMGDKRV